MREHAICARRTPEGKQRVQRLLQDAASECNFLHNKVGSLLIRSSQPGVPKDYAVSLEEIADYEELHIDCVRKEIQRLQKLLE